MQKDLQKTCVPESGTILDGLRALDVGGLGIALVLGAEGRLAGILTDGDLRRAILRGADLQAPLAAHVQRRFTSVGPEASRAEVLDLMQARVYEQVPIVDARGQLVGLHLLHELLGAVDRPNWAVIMAGGKGTRLRPITESIPKPMVRVAGRPILERLVLHLVGFGIRRLFLSVHYLPRVIEDHFGDGSALGCRIEYLREPEPLGTGGALSLLPAKPEHPLLVLNGDLVTQANLDQLLEFHRRGGYAATMAVRRYLHTVPFGCVEGRGGRIERFEEKPVVERLVNAGIYVIEPRLLGRVPRAAYPLTTLFEECLEKGEPVGAFEMQDDWIDVGQREQLRQAQEGGA